jgi:hypothetical protein
MCSPYIRKQANRYYWIVKGHLIPTSWPDKEVVHIYDSYMKRIWGNHENCVHEDGFELAYNNQYLSDDDISKVAVLGYD